MNNSRNRNELILRRRRLGDPRREVAREFGLSVSRISAIEREAAEAKSLAARRARVREEMVRADDLDKAWPVASIVEALGLPVIFRVRLLDYFEESGKEQISLREFFSMVVAPSPETAPRFQPIPILRVWGVGRIGRRRVIAALQSLDMGRQSNEAWRDLFARFAPSWLLEEVTQRPGRTVEG